MGGWLGGWVKVKIVSSAINGTAQNRTKLHDMMPKQGEAFRGDQAKDREGKRRTKMEI